MTEEQYKQIEGKRCTIRMRDGMTATGRVNGSLGRRAIVIFGETHWMITSINVEHHGMIDVSAIVNISRAEGV